MLEILVTYLEILTYIVMENEKKGSINSRSSSNDNMLY